MHRRSTLTLLKTKRLFLALWPDEQVRAGIVALRRRLEVLGRLVPADNLHVTLVFLGSLSEERAQCVVQACAAVRSAAFELVLREVQFPRRSRMAWLVPSAATPPLQRLVDALNSALVACGHGRERRPFSTHVTLVRDLRNRPRPPGFDPIVWPVRDFCLVQSTPKPAGSAYTVLHRWSLVSR